MRTDTKNKNNQIILFSVFGWSSHSLFQRQFVKIGVKGIGRPLEEHVTKIFQNNLLFHLLNWDEL
mgnify:FL=1